MNNIPPMVVEVRRSLCLECFDLALDPCAACAHGKWDTYVRCEPNLPTLGTIAANIAMAAVDETLARLSGMPPISEGDINRRLSICSECNRFRPSDQRCSLCGCFLDFKTRLRSQDCPLGKWHD